MRMRSLIENLGYDTRHALRGMRRRPGFTAIVAGTLALGIGATVTMFGVLDKLLLHPPALIADPDRVVMLHVRASGHKGVQTNQPYGFHKFMRDNVPEFEDVATVTPTRNGRNYYPVGRGAAATRAAGRDRERELLLHARRAAGDRSILLRRKKSRNREAKSWP